MMDVKQITGGCVGSTPKGMPTRSRRRGAPVAERARRVEVEYTRHARELDQQWSRRADGTPYPGVRDKVRDHLGVGPVLSRRCAPDTR